MDSATEKSLKQTLMSHARGLGIPEGAAESFIKNSMASAKKALKDKGNPTEKELTRALVKELKKYSPDLAYVFENYDKII